MPGNSLHLAPAVVFVDDVRWESFIQLAAILRKAGIRTVRVSVGPSGWRAEHVLFDRNVVLPVAPTAEQLSEILSNEYVADVHPTESLAVTSYAALDLLPAAQRSDVWIGRSAFLDKWRVAGVLRELGLRTPDALLADATSPIEAVATLSLPIVLKRRVGSSGSSVNVFETLESLQEFVAEIDEPSDWLFERFTLGRSLTCASCVTDDGIDVIATYEILKRIHLHGPSSVVQFRNDAGLTESGKMLFGAMHIRGLACFDIIRDSDNIDWIHDVNVRVFGGIAMCQLAGFDFRGAYVRCLLGRGRVEPDRLDIQRTEVFGFPEGRKDVLGSGPRGTAGVRTVLWIWRHWRLLGSRYFLFFTIERPVSFLLRNCERWGLRRRPPLTQLRTESTD